MGNIEIRVSDWRTAWETVDQAAQAVTDVHDAAASSAAATLAESAPTWTPSGEDDA